MPADPARAADLDATGLALALEDGATSAEAVLEVLLDRIARHDGRLRAFVALDGERARAAARGADRGRRAGHAASPLHGVAVAVKDIIDVAGQPTGLGSPGGGGRGRARESATVVEAAIAAGMVAVGKTHTVEYAFGGWGLDPLGGAPWNPWDAAVHRVPGGSSGGSAVAVAAGLVAVAIGTDTVGSIRVPASFAGVVGLRTTTTAVDRRGVLALAPSLDTVGPLVRSVRDAELMLALLAGAGTGDLRAILAKARATAAPGLAGLRIAVPGEGEREGVAAEVLARFDDSVRALARRGATVAVAAGLPASAALAGVTRTILLAEAHAAHHGVAGDPASGLGAAVRAKLLAGAAIGARDYLAALAERDEIRRLARAALAGCDVLLTPATETVAPPLAAVDEGRSPARFARLASLLDCLALVLPNGRDGAGMPTGLQIVAGEGSPARLFAIARACEAAARWAPAAGFWR